jgi:hypothetical protein
MGWWLIGLCALLAAGLVVASVWTSDSRWSQTRDWWLVGLFVVLTAGLLIVGFRCFRLAQKLPESGHSDLPVCRISSSAGVTLQRRRASVLITLGPKTHSDDVNVAVRVRTYEDNPAEGTVLIAWPGQVALTERERSRVGRVTQGDDVTEIEAPMNDLIGFTWIGGVRNTGGFRKRIALRLGDYLIPPLDEPKPEDLGYMVRIVLTTPSSAQSVTTIPTATELAGRDKVTFREHRAWVDLQPIPLHEGSFGAQTSTNFETTYELRGAASRRDVVLIVAGILVGIAGNLIVSILALLLSQNGGAG